MIEHALPYRDGSYSVRLYRSIHACNGEWRDLQPAGNPFLQTGYLTALEESPPDGMRFRYGIVHHKGRPMGLVYCQSNYYQAYESLNYHRNRSAARWKRALARLFNFHALACGNTLLTGQNGFWLPGMGEEAFDLVICCIDQVKQDLKKEGIRVRLVLYKDYYRGFGKEGSCGGRSAHRFEVQPNMILTLRKGWSGLDDYLDDMQSKYRVRARKAFSRLEGIGVEEWNEDTIRSNRHSLHNLYDHINEKAPFNLFELNAGYWDKLKTEMGDDFRLLIFRKGEEIVGFFTAILTPTDVDAHFLGYVPSLLKKYDLYLNMLYTLVRLGIETGRERVIFSRTAMEIKSSVGAEPVPMYCYFQMDNPVLDRLFRFALNSLNPTREWRQRSPFRQ